MATLQDVWESAPAGTAAPTRMEDVWDAPPATPAPRAPSPQPSPFVREVPLPPEPPVSNESGGLVGAVKASIDAAGNPGQPTTPLEASLDAVSGLNHYPPGVVRSGVRAAGVIPRWGAKIERYIADVQNTPRPPGQPSNPYLPPILRPVPTDVTGATFEWAPEVPTVITENDRRMAMAQEPASPGKSIEQALPPNKFDATIGGAVVNTVGELPSVAAMGPAAPFVLGGVGASDVTKELEARNVSPEKAQLAGAGVGVVTAGLFGASPLARQLRGATAAPDAIADAAQPTLEKIATRSAQQFGVGAGIESAHAIATSATTGDPLLTAANAQRVATSGALQAGLTAMLSIPHELGISSQDRAQAREAVDYADSLKNLRSPSFPQGIDADKAFLMRVRSFTRAVQSQGLRPVDAAAAVGMSDADLRAAMELQGAIQKAKGEIQQMGTPQPVSPVSADTTALAPRTLGEAFARTTLDDVFDQVPAAAEETNDTAVNSGSQREPAADTIARQDQANEPGADQQPQGTLAGPGGTQAGSVGSAGDRPLGVGAPDAGGAAAPAPGDAGGGVPGGAGGTEGSEPAAQAPGSGEPGAPAPGSAGATPPAGVTPQPTKAPPLPPLDPQVDRSAIESAWNLVASHRPDVAAGIKRIEPLDDYRHTNKSASFDRNTGILRVKPGKELTAQTLAHEFEHVAQMQRGEMRGAGDFNTEDEFDTTIEAPARAAGERFKEGVDQATPTAATNFERTIEQPLKIGAPQTIMNVPSTLARTESIDGTRFELFSGSGSNNAPAAIRIYDEESGHVLSLGQYPNVDAAQAAFADHVEKARAVLQPPTQDLLSMPREQLVGIAKAEGVSIRGKPEEIAQRIAQKRNSVAGKTAAPPQPRGPRQPEGLRRSDLEKEMMDALDQEEDQRAGYRNEENSGEHGILGAGGTTFYRKLPEDVQTFLEGRQQLRRFFKVTQQASEAHGENTMAQMGGEYFDRIEQLGRGRVARALEAAKRSPDPRHQWIAATYETMGKTRPLQEKLDPNLQRDGTEFSVNGRRVEVRETEDGYKVLEDGDEFPVVPAEAVGTIGVDAGSVRASEPGAEINLDEDFAPADVIDTAIAAGIPEERAHELVDKALAVDTSEAQNDSPEQANAIQEGPTRPGDQSQQPAAQGGGRDAAGSKDALPGAGESEQSFTDQSQTGIFGQPVITSSGVGKQSGLFHEPVNVEVPREKAIGSKNANAPENTSPMFPQAKGGGGGGSGGSASSVAPSNFSGLHNIPPGTPGPAVTPGRPIQPVQMPELFRLATELLGGKFPQAVGRLRRALGQFRYAEGTRETEIRLNRKALGEDPRQLAATMAHELGHLWDYLPNLLLSRGNVLGRLGSLLDWKKHNVQIAGTLYKLKDVRQEMLDLSRWWKPYDPAKEPEAYIKYRESSKELYADFISVLLNNPADVQARAPKAFAAFFGALDMKPEVRDAFFTMQDLLNGTPEELAEARRSDMREMESKAEDVARARAIERRDGAQSLWANIKQALFDHSMPARTMEAKANPDTVPWDQARAASHTLEELDMIHNPIHLMLKEAAKDIVAPLEKIGVTRSDLGDYLFHSRVGEGDRGGVGELAQEEIMKITGKGTWPAAKEEFLATAARDPKGNLMPDMQELLDRATSGKLNPHGYTPQTSRQYLDGMKNRMSADQWLLLQKKATQLRDMIWDKTELLSKAGVISKSMLGDLMVTKDAYIPFAVVKYFDNRVGAGIMKQVGTFEDIVNPFDAALLKMSSMIRLAKLNEAKLATLKVMRSVFPGIGPSVPVDQFHPAENPKGGKENLFHHIDGKLHVVQVDPYINRVFQSSDIGMLGRIADAISRPTYGIFHRLYVAFNAGWITREIVRGYKRTYKNAAVLHADSSKWVKPLQDALDVGRATGSMMRSALPALRYALGKDDPIVNAMLKASAIQPTGRLFRPDIEDSTIYERTLATGGLLEPKRGPIARTLMYIPDAVEKIGHFAASVPKIAMWDMATRAGKRGRERAYIVRNYGGIPNTARRGLATRLTNALFLYSKITLEGWRADSEVAFNPKTAQGYWLRAFLIDFLPKIAMYAGAAGLMGIGLKKLFDDIPDYDKTKYIIVPLGTASNGKTVYLRLPHDRAHKTLAAALWKFMNGHGVEGLGQSVAIAEDDLPSANPFWLMANKWKDYLAGRVPHDDYTGRDIINKDQQAAGGADRLKPMLYWQFDQMGEPGHYLRIALEGDKGESGVPKTTTEKVIQAVPGLNAMVKVSDRGRMEDEWKDVDEQDRAHALLRLSLPQNVRDANVERYRLDRLGAKRLDPAQEKRRELLNYWNSAYNSYTRKITDADAAGDKQVGQQLREQLGDFTEQLLKQGDVPAARQQLRESMQLKPAKPAAQ